MINIPSTLKISIKSLMANKMRTFLTMLGIIIGDGAVVALVAIGSGSSQRISDQISSMGSNLIMVMPGSTTSGGIKMGAGTQQTLSVSDADAIKKDCPSVYDVAPEIKEGAQIIYGNQNWSTQVMGTTPGFFNVRDWDVEEGRILTEQDVKSNLKVCILGQTVVENLMGGVNPVGKIIRIKRMPYTVIGVLKKKGQSAMGQDQDDIIIIPITTAQKNLFGSIFRGMVKMIMVKANSNEALEGAQIEIEDLLKQRHRIRANEDNDFTVRNLSQIMETAQEMSSIMTMLLGAIASISLIVGGIGIMNIMLVSVTERTREIGIRMAIGAKTWDIRFQFIIESLTLSVIGGIIGILVGIGASKIISIVAETTVLISPVSILVAFCFSAFIGIFFGFYPAYKASLLNPIDALRYE